MCFSQGGMSSGRDGKLHGLAYVIYKESISNRLLDWLLKTGYLAEQYIYLGHSDVSSSMMNKNGNLCKKLNMMCLVQFCAKERFTLSW